MIKTVLHTSLLFLFLIQINTANAAFIFESAANPAPNPTPNLGGMALDDDYFVMHRFYLDASYQIDTIGAYFEGANGETVFGALIGLTDGLDFPDSVDLSTSDVLTTTLLTIGKQDGDYAGSVNTKLDAGWYAVAFGTGRFGADNVDFFNSLILPDLAVDLALDDLPITAILESNPFNLPAYFTFQLATTRFFVTTADANSVPTAGNFGLFLIGIGMMLANLARITKKRTFLSN